MKLQEHILKRYKSLYPEHTLKEISQKTGLQITRVFRILNGSEMKVTEFEAFQNALEERSYNSLHFITTAKKCLQFLSEETLQNLNNEMILKLSIKNQVNLLHTFENQNNLFA